MKKTRSAGDGFERQHGFKGGVGVYRDIPGEVGHRSRGLQDGGGVHPYSFGDDAFRAGGHGYESLFYLSWCEVGLDVVEDVACVRVQVWGCEGLF